MQAHHEAGGSSSISEGCNVSCSCHSSSFWHCTGCLLSWGRGDVARFAGIAVLGALVAVVALSVQIIYCFNLQ